MLLIDEWFVLPGNNRIAALLRRARSAGHLEAFATGLRASPRPCWQPYAQAVDALLQGRAATTLKDAQAVRIFRLLQTTDATAAPETKTPKARKRKKD